MRTRMSITAGLLASALVASGAAQAPRGTAAQRVGDAVERAQREHDQRYDDLLPE